MTEGEASDGGQGVFMWKTQQSVFSNSGSSSGSDHKSEMLLKSQPKSSTQAKRVKRGHSTRSSTKATSLMDGGEEESEHETHKVIERERRKKMSNMFSNLRELLPHLPPKVNRSTIVDEAVNYINSLEHTLQNLQKQKLKRIQGESSSFSKPSPLMVQPQQERVDSIGLFLAEQEKNLTGILASPTPISFSSLSNNFPIWSSPNMILNVSGADAHISIWASKKPIVPSNIANIMEQHKVELVSCHINSDCFKCMYMIHARVSEVDQFLDSFMVQQIFSSVINELLNLISS